MLAHMRQSGKLAFQQWKLSECLFSFENSHFHYVNSSSCSAFEVFYETVPDGAVGFSLQLVNHPNAVPEPVPFPGLFAGKESMTISSKSSAARWEVSQVKEHFKVTPSKMCYP